jgi:hypothetical protein
MQPPRADSLLHDLCYRLGYALEELNRLPQGKLSAAAFGALAGGGPGGAFEPADGEDYDVDDVDDFDDFDFDDDYDDYDGDDDGYAGSAEGAAARSAGHRGLPGDLGYLVGTTGAGWLAVRLLRPRRVRWPRLLLAAAGATALYQAARALEGARPLPPADPELELPVPAHYLSALAVAAAYAAVVHPRLPGPGYVRGVAFGAFDAVTAEAGGAFGVLRRLAPALPLPLMRIAAPSLPPAGPLAHLAFGAGLGLLYGDD